jgi:Cryptococcal mannosyltransferase 1
MMPSSTLFPPLRSGVLPFFLRFRWRQAFKCLLAPFILLILYILFAFLPYQTPSTSLNQNVGVRPSNFSSYHRAAPSVTTVFIAALLRNSEDVLKGGWSDAVINMTRTIGPENVWVSIHESGSHDGTKRELQLLRLRLDELGARHDISLADVGADMHTMMPKDGPGWLNVKGKHIPRRIPWLAELRNMNLEPLAKLTARNTIFDKILFLNDVIFTSDDALELLFTRDGHYGAACGFDYSRLWPAISFYDQFATRDSNGEELLSLYYPYFQKGESKKLLREGSPVPVKSCWSGIAAFDAAPFQDPTHPLRFRAIDDSLAEKYLEASECCLIHYDNPASTFQGVYMNSNVRVGYDTRRYDATHSPAGWPKRGEMIVGWFTEWFSWTLALNGERKTVDQRFKDWTQENNLHKEVGSECLVNKMMVISEEGEWKEMKEARF